MKFKIVTNWADGNFSDVCVIESNTAANALEAYVTENDSDFYNASVDIQGGKLEATYSNGAVERFSAVTDDSAHSCFDTGPDLGCAEFAPPCKACILDGETFYKNDLDDLVFDDEQARVMAGDSELGR